MIEKIAGMKNGYTIGPDSTNEEFQRIIKSRKGVRCILVNRKTRAHFQVGLMGRDTFTINNRINDQEFYINNFL
jgi:hypothetical protein